jgi:hypothetical protein
VTTPASLPKGGIAVVIGRPTGPLHLQSRNGEWHGLALTEDDIDDVVAFLASLTGESSAARYGEGIRTEAIPVQTASDLGRDLGIVQVRPSQVAKARATHCRQPRQETKRRGSLIRVRMTCTQSTGARSSIS